MGFAVFLSAGRPRRPRSGRMQSIQVIVIKIKRLAYRLIGLACAAGRTRKVRQRPLTKVQVSAGSHELPELAAEP
jgi:hypothetical protein